MKKQRMTSQALKLRQDQLRKYFIESDSDSDLSSKAKQKQKYLNSNDNQGRALKKIYAGGGEYIEVLANEDQEWQNEMQQQDKRCTNLPQAIENSGISEQGGLKMKPHCVEYEKQSWDNKNNEQLNEDKDKKRGKQKIKQKGQNKNIRKRKLLCKREQPRNQQLKQQKIKANRRKKMKQLNQTKKQRLAGSKKSMKSQKQKKGKKKDKISNQVYNGILDHFT